MPRKPTPPPEPELALVGQLADALELAERMVDSIRAMRNAAMVNAKAAGATGDHLAAAARIARRNAVSIVGPATEVTG